MRVAELMKKKYVISGIKRDFSKIRRFSCEEFNTDSSELKSFYQWCQSHEILDEDLKSAVRVLKLASLFEQNQSIEAVINSAWDSDS